MAKIPAKYLNESDIPAGVREYYIQQGSEWVLDYGDDVAALTNPALERNRNALKAEKETERLAKEEAELQVASLKRQKSELDRRVAAAEGEGVKLPADKVAAIAEIEKLFPLGEVPAKLTELETVKVEAMRLKQRSSIMEAAKEADFNDGILEDLLTHPQRGAGLTLVQEDVTTGEGEDAETVKRWFIKQKKADNTVEKFPVVEFAAKQWPTYMSALRKSGGGNEDDEQQFDGSDARASDFKFPEQRQTKKTNDKQRADDPVGALVGDFNTARNSVPNPLTRKRAGQA